jgi:hypothetical protein
MLIAICALAVVGTKAKDASNAAVLVRSRLRFDSL